jgi:hypothetical protein
MLERVGKIQQSHACLHSGGITRLSIFFINTIKDSAKEHKFQEWTVVPVYIYFMYCTVIQALCFKILITVLIIDTCTVLGLPEPGSRIVTPLYQNIEAAICTKRGGIDLVTPEI